VDGKRGRGGVREGLLLYLRCPVSGGKLHLEATLKEEEEILDGTLISPEGARYPIQDGIPNLVVEADEKVRRTGDQFAFEFLEVGEP